MPGVKFGAVFEIAVDNHGYVTVEQAREVDVSPKALYAMARRGTLEHVSNGVYRVAAIPPSPHSEFMQASLWPRGLQAVISHDSALVLHELSDVNPARIHITVPPTHRVLRRVPALYTLHHANLRPADVEYVNGIPVTSPSRTILDCCQAHLGPALIRQALEEGVQRGLLNSTEAKRLAAECLPREVLK